MATAQVQVQASVFKTEEGRVYDSVEQDLSRLHADKSKFNRSIYQSICSTSRVTRLDYCQSELSDQVAGVPTSVASLSMTSEFEKKRLPRKWGSINHDFVVVHLTVRDGSAKGEEIQFCIVAEKVGEGLAGEPAGIYIGVLSEDEVRDLHRNVLKSWDCYSIPVPVDVLTKALWKDQDPNYNFVNNNCWYFAQQACRNVLLLLSKRDNVSSQQKSELEDRSQEVTSSVVKTAALESSARGSMYIVGAATVYFGFKAASAVYTGLRHWMASKENEQISTNHLNERIEDGKQKGRNRTGEIDEEDLEKATTGKVSSVKV